MTLGVHFVHTDTDCKTFTPLFYCTSSQMMVHLVPFVGDSMLAYLLQKTACLLHAQKY